MSDQEIMKGTVANLRRTRRFRQYDADLIYIDGLKRFSFRKSYSGALRRSRTHQSPYRDLGRREPLL